MTTVASAAYVEGGSILAVIDGWTMFVPNDPRNRDRQAIAAWEAAGHTIAAAAAPDAAERAVVIYAVARMTIADGDIAGMDMTASLAGAFRFDLGQYWCFFAEPQPDTDYFALVYDNGDVRGFVRAADKYPDYFIVSTVDFGGAPADAETLCVEIKRVT